MGEYTEPLRGAGPCSNGFELSAFYDMGCARDLRVLFSTQNLTTTVCVMLSLMYAGLVAQW